MNSNEYSLVRTEQEQEQKLEEQRKQNELEVQEEMQESGVVIEEVVDEEIVRDIEMANKLKLDGNEYVNLADSSFQIVQKRRIWSRYWELQKEPHVLPSWR